MRPLSSGNVSQPAMATTDTTCACQHQRTTYSSGIRRRQFILTASVVAMSLLAMTPACLVSAFVAVVSIRSPPSITTATSSFAIHNNGSDGRFSSRLSASKGNNKDLSSSNRERRDEDRRRKERKEDVVIGKTSANRDAVDYPISPEATEIEYLRRASQEERLVHQYTDEGMNAMKALRLELADKYFDKVFEVRPDAYLWQAGIVKFYLNDTKGAARIFANSAVKFETKFGPMGMGPASEERIWRNAAELKYFNSLKTSGRKQYVLDKQEGTPQIDQILDSGDDGGAIGVETRMIHRLTRELFDASVDQWKPIEVVARAKLLSFAGNDEKQRSSSINSNSISQDIKKRKLNACYYLALHYDVTGDIEESKKWIKIAFKLCTSAGKSSDIMDTLPLLHMTARDWFDDDPYDEDDEGFGEDGFGSDGLDPTTSNSNTGSSTSPTAPESKTGGSEHMSDAYSDPLLEASIMENVGKMKFSEIREALRIRGVSATGNKETLMERLFISLMDDAGFQSESAP